MPDQPDDAPKRPSRGVFPPFFVPRPGGHAGGGQPTPPSGSWRRVSRLFTPPEGTRQRRTPAAQQPPYRPAAVPVEPVAPVDELAREQEVPEVREVEETPDLPVAGAPEAVAEQPDATLVGAADAEAPMLEHDTSHDAVAGAGTATSSVDAFGLGAEYFDSRTGAPETGEGSLDAIAELAFGDDAEDFMVESLEPQPITLQPSEEKRLDVDVESMDEFLSPSAAELESEPFASDLSYDEMYAAASYEDAQSSRPEPSEEDLESVERYLAADPAQETALADDTDALLARCPEEVVAHEEDASVESGRDSLALQEQPASQVGAEDQAEVALQDRAPFAASDVVGDEGLEMDPWAGAELPEPAFGTIGWPPMEDSVRAPQAGADGVDEMSAALAWSDEDGVASGAEDRAAAPHDMFAEGEDALSAVAGELRETSSAWKVDGDSPIDENTDVEARAHFYAAPEPIDPEEEIAPDVAAELPGAEEAAVESPGQGVAEVDVVELPHRSPSVEEMVRQEIAASSSDDADPASRHTGAAIADALARVAARIRAGEIDLPPEAVGESDESALAAALAALLRRPRH